MTTKQQRKETADRVRDFCKRKDEMFEAWKRGEFDGVKMVDLLHEAQYLGLQASYNQIEMRYYQMFPERAYDYYKLLGC